MNVDINLKINLMYYGVTVLPNALSRLPKGKFGNLTYHDYPTTGGIILHIGEYYINTVVNYNNTYELDFIDNKYYLKHEQETTIVNEVISPPRFALDNTCISTEEPVRNIVMTHSDRTRISPITGCNNNCRFCDLPGLVYNIYTINELKESFEIAISDELLRPEHVLISGGTPKTDETSYKMLNEIYSYFPKHYSNFDFDVMLSPRGLHHDDASDKGFTDFLLFLNDSNIKGLSINLELYNTQQRKEIIPEKEEIGLDNYFSFIEKSVSIFGKGAVRSLLLVGLEDMEYTLAGVEELAKRGCMPILSPFIPSSGTFLSQTPAPTPEYQLEVLSLSKEICKRHDIFMGPACSKCSHNVIH